MPKLLVSDAMTGVRTPVPPLYACEFLVALSFRLSTKKIIYNNHTHSEKNHQMALPPFPDSTSYAPTKSSIAISFVILVLNDQILTIHFNGMLTPQPPSTATALPTTTASPPPPSSRLPHRSLSNPPSPPTMADLFVRHSLHVISEILYNLGAITFIVLLVQFHRSIVMYSIVLLMPYFEMQFRRWCKSG
jgi:hypothetical protein